MKCNLSYFGETEEEATAVLNEAKTVFDYKITGKSVFITFELDGVEITDKLEWDNAQYRIERDLENAKRKVKG